MESGRDPVLRTRLRRPSSGAFVRQMKSLRLALVVACVAFAPGAAAQRGQSTLVTTPVPARKRVESGITVLEHDQAALARATRLTLVATPVTVAGSINEDPAYDLTRAYNAVLLADGRIATLARVGNRLLVFGVDGHGQRSLGHTGQGPG